MSKLWVVEHHIELLGWQPNRLHVYRRKESARWQADNYMHETTRVVQYRRVEPKAKRKTKRGRK